MLMPPPPCTAEVMTSPQQQPPDVFASYNNNNNGQQQQAPAIQQQQVVQQPPVVQQQQYQPQAAMAPAPVMQAPPVPMQAAPQPMMQAPPQMQMPTQQQPVVQQPLAPQQQPPQEQQTPPPAVVVTNNAIGNDSPVSQLGDVSVIAASANNVTGPAMPNATTPSQPLQPIPQPMPMQQQPVAAAPQMPDVSQPAPVVQQPVVAANPFDSFPAVASSLPTPAPVQTAQPNTQRRFAPALAPPPAMAPPQAPPSPPTDSTQPVNVQQVQQVVQQTLSPPMSPVNLAPQQQAYADPFGFTFSPLTSPVTSPGGSPSGSPGAMVQSTSVNSDPFGVFGGNNKSPTPPQMTNATGSDPFGAGALVPSAQAPAPVANGTVNDPFGIFGSGQPAQPAAQPEPTQTGHMFSPPAPAPQEAEDPWAAAGFGQSTSSQPETTTSQPSLDAAPAYNQQNTSLTGGKQEDKPITLDSNNLPSEGEYYEARINARSLGAMFFTARNLEETLFTKLANNIIEALGSRPVVSYVAEDSAANNAGVHLGHVILSVNGQDIQDPEQCANVIRNAPRPMNIRCYIPPDLELTLNEGRHLVKYDTKGVTAPASGVEWKRKYVVMGGIVSKPYMMNMFYRKKDYDIAVKEAHAGRKISVKVKQFDLRGARIVLQNKDGKPNYVNYQTERVGWHYITILPYKGYPIKISSESLEDLEPVYSAVRRFIRKDMDNEYQSRMQQSFGGGSGLGGGAPSRGRSMSPSRTESAGARHFNERGSSGQGQFEGFEDDPNATGQGSYWNSTQYVKGANKY